MKTLIHTHVVLQLCLRWLKFLHCRGLLAVVPMPTSPIFHHNGEDWQSWSGFCRDHGHTSAGHSRWLNALTDYQFQPSETLYILNWRKLWCNRDRTNENKICTTTGLRGATCYLRSELAAEKILELRTKVITLHPISLM